MDKQEIIGHINSFFLEFNDKAQRHQYAGSLPKDLNDLLLDFEHHFINYHLDSEPVMKLLSKYQLQAFHNQIGEIQTNFYLRVFDLFEEHITGDHEALIHAGNSSYAILTDEGAFERELELLLQNKRKADLRGRLNEYERQWQAEEKVRVNRKYEKLQSFEKYRKLFRYASAAMLVVAFLVWQPFHQSNKKLFNTYLTTQKELPFSKQNTASSDVRGDVKDAFNDFSEVDKWKAMEGYELFQKKRYTPAASAFSSVGVSPVKGRQFLIVLAISQLHTNELEKARDNLQAVLQMKDSTQHEDAHFYLALYYLKTGNRKEARTHLNILTEKPGRYYQESKNILNNMRWF